jgi:hypothetical protein
MNEQLYKYKFQRCDRCGNNSVVLRMSRFNTQMCCPLCTEAEERHPDYSKAYQAELDAVRRGDYNFPGIGLPADL